MWEKLGQIFKMKPIHAKLHSHASNPLAVHLKEDVFRIYFSGRDVNNRSSVGFVDIDIIKKEVVNCCTTPVVSFGNENSFYSHGISIGNLYEQQNKKYILFMGWNITPNEHWRGDIGRLELVSDDKMVVTPPNIPFVKVDKEDDISLSYPFVIFHEGFYKMWYGSTITWEAENKEMIHVIKYATSKDGETWEKKGMSIPYELNKAQAFSRPIVVIDNKGYHMWYSYRSGDGTKYRIGYSHSNDGINWNRKHEKAGIDISKEGWDSEMICYPFIFDHNGERYMLYNGNDFGKEGFGLAIFKK